MRLKNVIIINTLIMAVMVPLGWANESGESLTNQPATVEKASTAWNYKLVDYGFSITLPDSDWVARPSSIHGVAGFLKKGFAMRTDIFVVPCESVASFQGLAERVKNEMDSAKGISGTHHENGKTESGHQYQFSIGTEKTESAPEGVYLGQSVVWIENKNIAVRTCFQGESLNRSASIQGVDPKELEKSARFICLSVK
jgi:hypothetical protein